MSLTAKTSVGGSLPDFPAPVAEQPRSANGTDVGRSIAILRKYWRFDPWHVCCVRRIYQIQDEAVNAESGWSRYMKQTKHPIRSVGLLLALLALFPASSTPAQSIWTTPSSGNWGDALSWASGVPTIANAVLITNAPSKVITVDLTTPLANRAARRMDLNAPAGSTNTLRLSNLDTTPFQLANSFNLDTGSRLEISNSVMILDGAAGGSFNQFAGEIILAGGGLITTNSDLLATNGQPGLRIGRSGVGRATLHAGEIIASDELVIGDLGGAHGTLIQSNGLVQLFGVFYIANNPASVGLVEVYGGALIATNVSARIGDDGNGTLAQYAGTVILDSASVGRGSNAVGSVILRGGVMQPGSLSLGRFATAQGTLEVSGGTLDMSTKTLYVGREGNGLAVLSNGVASVETLLIAASNTASGTLQMRGGSLITGQLIADRSSAQFQFSSGTLVVTQATTVANGAAFVVGNGTQPATLQLDGGTHSFANGLVISANATLKGTGTVIGTITVLPGGSNQLGTTPASIALTPSRVNGVFRFSFPSTTGKLYDVLATTNVATPNWQLQTTLSGTGALLTYTNTSPVNPRFFRVQIR